MKASENVIGPTLNFIAHIERHGKGAQSGTLRAGVFGVNDGLVSNLSLVMGAGEYLSMLVQRETFEKLIAVEKQELATTPDAERLELEGIYENKEILPEQAAKLSEIVMSDEKLALETHVREELGLNTGELGSPWGAAMSSFFAFVGGAIIPVLPYIFSSGTTAFVLSIVLSGGGLLAVSAALSFVTGKSWILSGLRMLRIGELAAAVTYLVGYLLGVSIET